MEKKKKNGTEWACGERYVPAVGAVQRRPTAAPSVPLCDVSVHDACRTPVR